MKLKLVVASMSVLGLISCPVFAVTTTKHKYQKHYAEQSVKDQEVVREDESYKGEEEVVNYKGEALPILVTCPKVDVFQPILDMRSKNVGRAKATVDCDKPIRFAGGINFDYQMLSPLNRGFMGENPNRFALNDAYLNATADINRWVQAFLELSYSNIDNDIFPEPVFFAGGALGATDPKPGIYSQAYRSPHNSVTLQQGIIFVGNLEEFPVFGTVGKQFVDFGQYVIHPISRSMTQVLTETLQTSVELSFISSWNGMDIHGTGFAFQDTLGQIDADDATGSDEGNKHTNYGAQLGVGKISDQLGFDVGVGYIYNMMGINDVGYAVSIFNSGDFDNDGSYFKRVDALTVYGMLNTGPFSFNAHYVTALKEFDSRDLTSGESNDDGAKPWAVDVTAAYGFNYFGRAQNLYVGYQHSEDAVNLFLPEDRWLAGYGIDIMKNTNIALEYSYDEDYSEGEGGTGDNSSRIGVRLGVKFG